MHQHFAVVLQMMTMIQIDDDETSDEIQIPDVVESAPLNLHHQNQDIINWAEGICYIVKTQDSRKEKEGQ